MCVPKVLCYLKMISPLLSPIQLFQTINQVIYSVPFLFGILHMELGLDLKIPESSPKNSEIWL